MRPGCPASQVEFSALQMRGLRNCYPGLAHSMGIEFWRSPVRGFGYNLTMHVNVTDVVSKLRVIGVLRQAPVRVGNATVP